MKKLPIILLALLFNLSAMSQIKIITEQVEITLPIKVQRVNKPQSIPNDDGTVTLVMGGEYGYEGQFLSIDHSKINRNPSFLTEINNGIENRRKRFKLIDEYYQNWVENTSNSKRIISRNKGDGFNYYLFYVVNKSYTHKVSGTLQFKPGEELKARLHLNEVLKGISFKN